MTKALSLVIVLFASTALSSILTSLPKKWTGVAGDLVTRVPAEFVIVNSSLISEKNGAEEYEVNGYFKFDSRIVKLQKLELNSFKNQPEETRIVEMTIYTYDELVPNIFVTVKYDSNDKAYIMKDMLTPPNGRRFILRGLK